MYQISNVSRENELNLVSMQVISNEKWVDFFFSELKTLAVYLVDCRQQVSLALLSNVTNLKRSISFQHSTVHLYSCTYYELFA